VLEETSVRRIAETAAETAVAPTAETTVAPTAETTAETNVDLELKAERPPVDDRATSSWLLR
jgi:hypothetical protein